MAQALVLLWSSANLVEEKQNKGVAAKIANPFEGPAGPRRPYSFLFLSVLRSLQLVCAEFSGEPSGSASTGR